MSKTLDATNKNFSLAQRQKLKEADAKKVEMLGQIDAATGAKGWDIDFEGDVKAYNEQIPSEYKDNWPAAIIGKSYLENLVRYFQEQCNDEMVKEALLESVPEKKIVFRPATELTFAGNQDQMMAIKDGKFVIGCHPSKFDSYVWNAYACDAFKLNKML